MLKLKLQYFDHMMWKDWYWERLRAGGEWVTEDEMIGLHHWLNGHEFEKTPGDSGGQRSLECCSLWGHKEWTPLSNWTTKIIYFYTFMLLWISFLNWFFEGTLGRCNHLYIILPLNHTFCHDSTCDLSISFSKHMFSHYLSVLFFLLLQSVNIWVWLHALFVVAKVFSHIKWNLLLHSLILSSLILCHLGLV